MGDVVASVRAKGWQCVVAAVATAAASTCVPLIKLEPPDPPALPSCGDGAVDPGEECDGENLADQTCTSLPDPGRAEVDGRPFAGGGLACDDHCKLYTGSCTSAPRHCDGEDKDGVDGEQCDGDDLGGATCGTLGRGGGALGCTPRCTFDATQCARPTVCGNGTLEMGEECDRPDHDAAVCDDACRPVAELRHCADGKDNDGDELVDCGDPDCVGVTSCAGEAVAPPGSRLQDVSLSGGRLAILDDQGSLSVVQLGGPESAPPLTGVASAVFAGNILVALRAAVDDAGNATSSAEIFLPDGTTLTATNVKVGALDASPDGNHIYFETAIDGGLEDLHLDGATVVPGAKREKVRFTPDSAFLVVGANIPSGPHFVRTFPVDGGSPALIVADNAANQTAVTHDGAHVIVGANERCADVACVDTADDDEPRKVVDLEIAPIAGGAPTLLQLDVDDAGFRTTADDSEVLYIVNPLVAPCLEAATVDGARHRTLATDAARLISISATHVVYAHTFDKVSGTGELRIVRLDGTGDTALGGGAVREDFTPEGRFYVFRAAVAAGGGRTVGRLFAFDTAQLTPSPLVFIGDNVTTVAIASDSTVVFLDVGDRLQRADLRSGATAVIAEGVRFMKLVRTAPGMPADRVAFDNDDGVFVQEL